MKLTEEQISTLKEWVTKGSSLSEIQAAMVDEFGISMTYLEARFLLDDLGIELKEKPASRNSLNSTSALNDVSVSGSEDVDSDNLHASDDFSGGGLRIEVSSLVKPGVVVHGSVTFTDGVHADWSIDSLGQLGLKPSVEGYRPSAEDIKKFQEELTATLQKSGF